MHFFAFGGGLGLIPKMPGTWGTVGALFIYYGLLQSLPLFGYLIIVCLASVIGVVICAQTAKDLKTHDHPSIVWDEFVGYWITMIAAPTGWQWMVVGFMLFRFFDILKPFPICWIDSHVKGGFGIMIDDIIAGLFAFLLLQSLNVFI